jgi:hypothetical protein
MTVTAKLISSFLVIDASAYCYKFFIKVLSACHIYQSIYEELTELVNDTRELFSSFIK